METMTVVDNMAHEWREAAAAVDGDNDGGGQHGHEWRQKRFDLLFSFSSPLRRLLPHTCRRRDTSPLPSSTSVAPEISLPPPKSPPRQGPSSTATPSSAAHLAPPDFSPQPIGAARSSPPPCYPAAARSLLLHRHSLLHGSSRGAAHRSPCRRSPFYCRTSSGLTACRPLSWSPELGPPPTGRGPSCRPSSALSASTSLIGTEMSGRRNMTCGSRMEVR
ncbi:hypothetical protein PVAP13_2NG336033 [Panicum virgatum]|uniref:Uncharacterized protein n=1 Tax=Panicum virgatum TaxID=38727 RepID=A0A8T0VE79_PANVG|nr:hypothetical protein PVAP13_2NG336033 [Panicum virgatum]